MPKAPDYKECGDGVVSKEDMEDVTGHGDEGDVVKLSSWSEIKHLKQGVKDRCVVLDGFEADGMQVVSTKVMLDELSVRMKAGTSMSC